jgi:hypothetical protein
MDIVTIISKATNISIATHKLKNACFIMAFNLKEAGYEDARRAERPGIAGFFHGWEPVYLDEGRSSGFQNL